ncbi:MAG: hypothetical protein ABH967_02820 [Patescibacteria group bacterium]
MHLIDGKYETKEYAISIMRDAQKIKGVLTLGFAITAIPKNQHYTVGIKRGFTKEIQIDENGSISVLNLRGYHFKIKGPVSFLN